MDNPIDEETCTALQNAYRLVNEYHTKEETVAFSPITHIRILNTFAFAGYIFAGFCITYIWGEGPMHALLGLAARIWKLWVH